MTTTSRTSHRWSRLLGGAALGAALLAGCGGDDGATSAPSSPADSPSADGGSPSAQSSTETSPSKQDQGEKRPAVLIIEDFAYSGAEQVSPGQTITVVNKDDAAHTVTARAGDDVFDVNVPAGAEAELTAPGRTGRFEFYCTYHATMTGTLTVA